MYKDYFTALNESFEGEITKLEELKEAAEKALEESRQMDNNFIVAFGEDFLNRFKAQKNRMSAPKSDLGYWIGLKNELGEEEAVAQLEDFLSELESTLTRSQARAKAREGAELIFEEDGWKVYHVTTYDAMTKYGANTRWCIAGNYPGHEGRGQHFFDQYLEDEFTGYFVAISPEGRKFCICPHLGDETEYSIYNEKDSEINYLPSAPDSLLSKFPDLPRTEDEVYGDDDDYAWEDEEEEEDEGPAEPVHRPFDLVMVERPVQISARSAEDALAQIGAEAVASLDNGWKIVKYSNEQGEDKFTIFIYENGEGGLLYTQTPQGFARVDYESQEAVEDFIRQNMANIQVQNGVEPREVPAPEVEEEEEEEFEEIPESLLESEGFKELPSFEAVAEFGKGTKWMVANDKKYYDSYLKNCPGCIFVGKGDGDNRVLGVIKDLHNVENKPVKESLHLFVDKAELDGFNPDDDTFKLDYFI